MTTELQQKMQVAGEKWTGINNEFTPERITFMAGADAMYAELAPLVEWVDVKERLPEINKVYLVKFSDGGVSCGRFMEGKWHTQWETIIKNLEQKITDVEVKFWRKIEV
jgi:hypothetical protein